VILYKPGTEISDNLSRLQGLVSLICGKSAGPTN